MTNEVLFKPSHALTFQTVQQDRNRLMPYLQDASVLHLQIDLGHVKHCDSAGLALLIEVKRLCKTFKKSLAIYNISAEINALAELCGVKNILF